MSMCCVNQWSVINLDLTWKQSFLIPGVNHWQLGLKYLDNKIDKITVIIIIIFFAEIQFIYLYQYTKIIKTDVVCPTTLFRIFFAKNDLAFSCFSRATKTLKEEASTPREELQLASFWTEGRRFKFEFVRKSVKLSLAKCWFGQKFFTKVV